MPGGIAADEAPILGRLKNLSVGAAITDQNGGVTDAGAISAVTMLTDGLQSCVHAPPGLCQGAGADDRAGVVSRFDRLSAAGFGVTLETGATVIAVAENTERAVHEEKLLPGGAAKQGTPRISPALAGIYIVLRSVFAPMAFAGGSTGVICRPVSIIMAERVLNQS